MSVLVQIIAILAIAFIAALALFLYFLIGVLQVLRTILVPDHVVQIDLPFLKVKYQQPPGTW